MGFVAPFLAEIGAWQALSEAPVAALACDRQGQLAFVNDAMCGLLGVDVEALVGLGWARLLFEDHGDGERGLRDLVDANGSTRHQRRLPSGRSVELTCAPVTFGAEVRGLLALGTAIERVDDVSAAGARGYESLVEDSPDLWLRLDATGRVIWANRAVERLTGLLRPTIYGDPGLFRAVIHPDYLATWDAALVRIHDGDRRSFDVALVHIDGRQSILELSLYPVAEQEAVGTVEGSGRDITQLRQLEAVRRRGEERAVLDRLKSQLLANVSHELRTPLVSIKGYNDLLLRAALGPLTARQRRGLEIAGANIDRLIELIETLLDFARREDGRLELERRRFDLRLAVEDALTTLAERIASRKLRMEVELGDEPMPVRGDRARLAQVFRALIGNAEKFMTERDGTAPDIVVGGAVSDGEVTVFVRDRGIGIPAAAQARIFDRFYQVDASSTRRFGGAGMGLALAKELVTLHAGRIAVESEEGAGSTFTVRLPITDGASTPAADTRVVLVGLSDDALALNRRRELEDALRELDPVDLLFATGDAEILRRAHRHRPDVILIAVDDADARARIVAELRRDGETATIPIIAAVTAGEPRAITGADLVVDATERARLEEGLGRLLGRVPMAAPAPAEVVVVEDEIEILDFTRFLLEREGYRVVCVQSGEQALAQVSARTGLVILDIALDGPKDGIDGIEVCRALKGRPASSAVPVLIVTAMSGDDVRKISMAAGANGYLVKPFGIDEFLRQVRLHLSP